MLICSNEVLVERRKIIRQEIENIVALLPQEKLDGLFMECCIGENSCTEIAKELAVNLEALNILYSNYLYSEEERKTLANRKNKKKNNNCDIYYDTKKLIRNIVIGKLPSTNESVIKVQFTDGTFEVYENTSLNRRLLQRKAYDTGRKLVDTLDSKTTTKTINGLRISANEKFYYKKWKLYFEAEKEIKDFKRHVKETDVDDVVSEKVINYKHLNSDKIPVNEIQRRTQFIKMYHERQIKK